VWLGDLPLWGQKCKPKSKCVTLASDLHIKVTGIHLITGITDPSDFVAGWSKCYSHLNEIV
jgi:hypothetical protein